MTPIQLAEKLRCMAATADGARNAKTLMDAADKLHALQCIFDELNGNDWDSDTTQNIADYLSACGLDVADVEN